MSLTGGGLHAGQLRAARRRTRDVFVTGMDEPEVHSDYVRFRLRNGDEEVSAIVVTLETGARCLRLAMAALGKRLFAPLNG